jgi:hypothetical protein
MLRRTSTRVKEVVEKMRPPAVVLQELLGRRPQSHSHRKATVRSQTSYSVDSPVSHQHTRAGEV